MRHAAVGRARCRCAIVIAVAIAWLSGLGAVRAAAQGQGQTDVERQMASGPRFLMTPARAPAARGAGAWEDASHLAVFQRRIAVDLHGVSLGQALSEVGQKAGLGVTYSPTVIRSDAPVNLSAPDITVGAAFSALLYDAGVDVLLTASGRVSIVKRVALEPPVGTIAGRVTDAKTGGALVGATVAVEGASRSGTTGTDGRYRIGNITPGTYTVRARSIGYSPAMQSVSVVEGQEAIADFTLAKSVQRLDEVVTTGTLIPTEVKALPTPITVITAEDIELQHIRRVDQAIQLMVPGAVVWEPVAGLQPGAQQVSFRGSSSLTVPGAIPYGDNPKTYVDGIQVVDNSFLDIDPQIIERIEVIRGPQATAIYGVDAMGGVVQIFTKHNGTARARPEIEARASLGRIESHFAGSGALRQEYGGAVNGRSGAATYRVGGGLRQTGDWLPQYGDQELSLQAGTHLDQGPFGVDLSFRLTHDRFDPGFDPRLGQIGGGAFFGPYVTQPSYQESRTDVETYAVAVQYQARPWWRQHLTVGVDRNGVSGGNTRPTRYTPDDTLFNVAEGSGRRISLSYLSAFAFSLAPALKATLSVGGDHYSFKQSGFTADGVLTVEPLTLAPTGSFFGNRSLASNTGLFAEAQIDLRETLFITGSLRAEDNSDFGADLSWPLSPRVGVSYVHGLGSATLKLRSSYGEAIRPPLEGAKDSSVIVPGLAYRLSNPHLRPERQIGPDFGVDLVVGTSGSLSVTYYDQTAKDFVSGTLVTAGPIYLFQFRNIARVKNTGWEFEGTLPLGPAALRGQFAIHHSRPVDLGPVAETAELRVGQQFVGQPVYTGAVTLTALPLSRTTVTAGLVYTGSWRNQDAMAFSRCLIARGFACYSDDPNLYYVDYPGYVKLNMSLERQLRREIAAYVDVEDLTNSALKRTRSNADAIQGRIGTVGVRVRW